MGRLRMSCQTSNACTVVCSCFSLLFVHFKHKHVTARALTQQATNNAQHTARDLVRQADRFGCTLRVPANHPVKSLSAQRLLVSADAKVLFVVLFVLFLWLCSCFVACGFICLFHGLFVVVLFVWLCCLFPLLFHGCLLIVCFVSFVCV